MKLKPQPVLCRERRHKLIGCFSMCSLNHDLRSWLSLKRRSLNIAFMQNWPVNCVFLDQPFPFMYIHRLFVNCSESEKSVFCRCLLCDKSPGFHAAFGESLIFCPYDSYVRRDFPDRLHLYTFCTKVYK